jgi:hypothetical protein
LRQRRSRPPRKSDRQLILSGGVGWWGGSASGATAGAVDQAADHCERGSQVEVELDDDLASVGDPAELAVAVSRHRTGCVPVSSSGADVDADRGWFAVRTRDCAGNNRRRYRRLLRMKSGRFSNGRPRLPLVARFGDSRRFLPIPARAFAAEPGCPTMPGACGGRSRIRRREGVSRQACKPRVTQDRPL